MRRLGAILVCIATAAVSAGGLPRLSTDQLLKQSIRIDRATTVRYLLFLPSLYDQAGGREWPLILYLHGSTEKGNDVDMVKRNGLPAFLQQEPDFPFVVVSPQLRTVEERWDPLEVKELLASIIERLRIDRDRVYLTGWSLGATGTWETAMRYPGLFAAIAPVAGNVDARQASLLRGVPAWVFHGADDRNVPAAESVTMVEALRSCGMDVRFTLYKDCRHDSWISTYSNPALFKWFLEHHLSRTVRREGAPG
jgi:predicted peptidase